MNAPELVQKVRYIRAHNAVSGFDTTLGTDPDTDSPAWLGELTYSWDGSIETFYDETEKGVVEQVYEHLAGIDEEEATEKAELSTRGTPGITQIAAIADPHTSLPQVVGLGSDGRVYRWDSSEGGEWHPLSRT